MGVLCSVDGGTWLDAVTIEDVCLAECPTLICACVRHCFLKQKGRYKARQVEGERIEKTK